MGQNLITQEYEGMELTFTEDGWFNATKSAERFGKRPVDWLRLPETDRYVEAVMEEEGISEKISLIRTKRNSGTWLHPALVVAFARPD